MLKLSLSIVIPVFNKAPYIADLVRSIQNQKSMEWEIIFVDDGSTDSSETICRYYAQNDPRIRYYKKDHSGIAKTRNYGNQRAKYDLISVADADDIWLPNRLEIIAKHFKKHPDTELFYTGIYEGSNAGTPVNYWEPKKVTAEELKKGNQGFVHGTSVYQKKVILETPYRPEMFYNDDFTLAIDFLKKGYKMRFDKEATVIYRVLPTSISRMYFKKIRRQSLKIAKGEL